MGAMSTSVFEDREVAAGASTLRSTARRSSAIVVLERAVIAASALAGLVFLLSVISSHVFAGNSDGATVVLEGQSISSGNLILHGWALSNDSFWSIDALFYAVFVHISGATHAALSVVPAVIAACVVALGLWFVSEEDRGMRAIVAGSFLILAIGIPNPDLSFFLLQGPWHVGTAVWCLVAFAGLAGDRWRWGFAIAIVALAFGILGDLETLPFGVVPVVLAGCFEMIRRRSLRSGLPSVVAGLLASGLAFAGRATLHVAGGFTISNGITHAHSSRYATNFWHAFSWLGGLLGAGKLLIGPTSALGDNAATNGASWSHLLYIPVVATVIVSVVAGLVVMIRGLIKGDRNRERSARSLRIDAFLLFGMAGSVASYVFLCPNNNADYARYLTAAALFALILTARTIARTALHLPRQFVAVVAIIIALLFVGVGFSTANNLSQPKAPNTVASLATFLAQHHLHVGIGDYWSSSIVTVASDNKVAIRPVITNPRRKIMRYGRQSDASWYSGVKFQFLVYNVAHPWRRINATTAIETFGRPKAGYDVGDFRVIVWSHPISVSSVGFTRG